MDNSPKRRRIIVEDDGDEGFGYDEEAVNNERNDNSSIGSNPDDQLDDYSEPEPDDGEDLEDTWLAYVYHKHLTFNECLTY